MICKICNKDIKIGGWPSHVRLHKITTKEYYDEYLKKEGEGFCKTCGKPMPFLSISKGYKKHCNQSCANKDPDSIRKGKETKKERYGNENYNNREKAKETCLQKYGVENSLQSEAVKEKAKITNLKRYGVEHNWKSKNPKLNGRATKKKKYGSETYNNQEKIKQTNKKRYGVEYYVQSKEFKEKAKHTMIKRYQVEHALQSNKIKSQIDWSAANKKKIETRRKNGTFNTSQSEKEAYELLQKYFSNVKRQYTDNKYPFNCDFYILELDLYIECNFHWTHGGHWFDENNEDDIKTIKEWEKRNTDYYKNAITTWTKRDVEKKKIAEKNKLNYIVFWDIEELKKWLII